MKTLWISQLGFNNTSFFLATLFNTLFYAYVKIIPQKTDEHQHKKTKQLENQTVHQYYQQTCCVSETKTNILTTLEIPKKL